MRHLQSYEQGSMTLEAALVLPLMIFMYFTVFSLLTIYHIHGCVTYAMWEQGRESGIAAYALQNNETSTKEEGQEHSKGIETVATGLLAREKCKKQLEHITQWKSMISGGDLGLWVSSTYDENSIVLECTYNIHPLVAGALLSVPCKARYYGHPWTGYAPIGSEKSGNEKGETYVYITKNGEVYHKNRKCSYLDLSVHAISKQQLSLERNDSGSKYAACDVCGRYEANNYYIARYGEKYHTTPDCSSLKRTIYEVPLSEVGGKRPCSKCGG